TELRFGFPILLLLMPPAGILMVWLYREFGEESHRGNKLILEHIHEEGAGRIPLRMTPLVLFSTVLTHLVGGSAGREGTAVQMGGRLAAAYGRRLGIEDDDMPGILRCGVAAGFGAVFGTPIAGALFALEVAKQGRPGTAHLLPALAAGLLGDFFCRAWGVGHTHYAIPTLWGTTTGLSLSWLLGALGLGILCAGVARFFIFLLHQMEEGFSRIPMWWGRPLVGSLMLLGLCVILGTTDYLGLGVTADSPEGVSIVGSFEGQVGTLSWFWKALFTAITLASGFKGGEVTPLFFIGSTLGAAVALWTGYPVDLLAGLGFVAVFAGATKTPLACTVMAAELFGAAVLPYAALACAVAFAQSGSTSIYSAKK
ncbi:MAG: chloride channel protein, partial [Candidatus Sumerlaeia bacterium]|nr:chloride channel protein [Candidatus Sumerlaeia bacterium]